MVLLLPACNALGGESEDASPVINIALLAALQQPTYTYTVTFHATWSSATHSGGTLGIPTNPHFSPPIGGTHSSSQLFWQPGATASNGIEQMAERGDPFPFAAEIEATGLSANILGIGPLDSPGTMIMTFSTSAATPLVTLVTMLAPSPDWFVGVHGLSLAEGGTFVQEKTVSLLVYDAGTDSGTTFTAADSDTNPKEAIRLITDTPLANNPVGTFTFTRQ